MAPISSAAIGIFKRMMALKPYSDEWERLDWELHRELQLHPWEGCPVVVLPGEKPVYPAETGGGQWERIHGAALLCCFVQSGRHYPPTVLFDRQLGR